MTHTVSSVCFNIDFGIRFFRSVAAAKSTRACDILTVKAATLDDATQLLLKQTYVTTNDC